MSLYLLKTSAGNMPCFAFDDFPRTEKSFQVRRARKGERPQFYGTTYVNSDGETVPYLAWKTKRETLKRMENGDKIVPLIRVP